MLNKSDLLSRVGKDLQLGILCPKGQKLGVRNCWHFSSDGKAVDSIFFDEEDFLCGMNRVYVVSTRYRVLILAFVLMDTHVHFILYGEFGECNRFIHEYLRLTSMYISKKYGDRNKLKRVPVSHQEISDDNYLKTAICYVVKNPPVGGLPYNFYDYPWGSGSLYFRKGSMWTSPRWIADTDFAYGDSLTWRGNRSLMKSHVAAGKDTRFSDGLIFPGEYVAVDIVEKLFRTNKSFNFFICTSRETDVESRGGSISMLSIPMQEMRQHKAELCRRMFGTESSRGLDMARRMMLAKKLKSTYNSSSRQIARLCGLVYDEVRDILD